MNGPQPENSDVLPLGSVAVAVAIVTAPTTAWKVALPSAPVVTCVEPTNVCPSPFPLPSQAALSKNSIVNWVDAVLLSVPRIVD
jgi:hypothetical protein